MDSSPRRRTCSNLAGNQNAAAHAASSITEAQTGNRLRLIMSDYQSREAIEAAYKAREAKANLERDAYLDALTEVNALAYNLAEQHVDTMFECSENVDELKAEYMVEQYDGTDILFPPDDAISTIENFLAASSPEEWVDATIRERLGKIDFYLTDVMAYTVKALIPIVLHHQRRQVVFVKAEIEKERLEDERRASEESAAEVCSETSVESSE